MRPTETDPLNGETHELVEKNRISDGYSNIYIYISEDTNPNAARADRGTRPTCGAAGRPPPRPTRPGSAAGVRKKLRVFSFEERTRAFSFPPFFHVTATRGLF